MPRPIESRQLRDMHAYVFTYHADDPRPHFERTFPADCLREAWGWIHRCKRQGFISIGCLPQSYWR